MSTVRATNFQHPSATNPAIVLAADGTAAATVSGINGGPLAGFRNAIINGNFDVWQRGTSVAGFGMVTADRWTTRSAVNTGGGLTQSQQPFTLGQTEVPGEPEFYWRLVFTGATGTPFVEQRIEDVRSFAGQTITISFWARRSSSSSSCFVDMVQSFGTVGSPSTAVTTSSTTFEVGTSWTYVTRTFSIPSITGKTFGTDDSDYLTARIWLGGTGSYTFELAQVQVEAGPVATPFERRPIGTELALCQRYYVQYAGTEFGGGSNSRRYASTGGVTWEAGHCAFPVQMRAVPNTAVSGSITYSNASSLSIEASSSFGARLTVSPTAAGVYSWSGATLAFDAEL